MHVLYAYDGSADAEQARELLAHIELPDDSFIEAVTVLRPRSSLFELGSVPVDPAEADAQLVDDLGVELQTVVRALSGAGRRVESAVLRGHPGAAIREEAQRIGADLIVMGSRGHGAIRSALLGSVSTEVSSQAHCSVLVARAPSVSHVMLAADGTATSEPALEAVASWPMFGALPVDVLSVSQPISSMIGVAPAFATAAWAELEMGLADERLASHREIARVTAERLRAEGIDAREQVATGNPAQEIVELARDTGADLIVTGSRRSATGFPGVLGSVARNVLQHASASVLVVRAAG